MTIKLNQPVEPNLEKLNEYLEQVNKSGWYTNFGPLHQLLTQRLEAYLGVQNLLLVSNGTLALQVAYKTLNVNKAITTPFSFVATTSSLIWQNIETIFSDVDRETYNLCPLETEKSLDLNSDVNTIVATHVYGNPCDVKAFEIISKQRNINVIYDAAHAFGVKVNGKSVLDFGNASILSFHATKVFHSIEGGAIIFKDSSDFDRAKRLINFGIDGKGNIVEAGINAKLNEYQCAVGLTLLDEIDDIINHRSILFSAYRTGLQDVVELPKWHEQANFNGAYMPIKLKSIGQRQLIERVLKDNHVECRQYFSPSLDTIFDKSNNYSCSNSQFLSQTVLCLPLHFYMNISDIDSIVELIIKSLSGM
jgi:dTDP-4-amino-4,6-dideoxygalactose transaminase